MCTNLINDKSSLKDWYENLSSKNKVETINLNEMDSWVYDDKNITHNSGKFFQVKGIRIYKNERENQSGWDQPILQEVNMTVDY